MSLTNLLVPTYTNMLKALAAWLEKAQGQISEPEAEKLLSDRLAPDMFPLSSQIRFACLQSREAANRLNGKPFDDVCEKLIDEGQKAGEHPGSMSDARMRINEALAFLAELGPGALDAGAQRPIVLELPNGMIFDMNGEEYARDWALPQFYFFTNTAYSILRGRGIDLGKADYVQHMFAYIRQGTMPES